MQNTITTKQLRENFPEIKKRLLKGESFVLIHRSQPIAEIKGLVKKEEVIKKLKKIKGNLNLGKNLSIKKIKQLLDERY